ncbi:hypothetical protein ACWX0P_30510 [Vibrio mediterranei]|jgi:hypothetical protein
MKKQNLLVLVSAALAITACSSSSHNIAQADVINMTAQDGCFEFGYALAINDFDSAKVLDAELNRRMEDGTWNLSKESCQGFIEMGKAKAKEPSGFDKAISKMDDIANVGQGGTITIKEKKSD